MTREEATESITKNWIVENMKKNGYDKGYFNKGYFNEEALIDLVNSVGRENIEIFSDAIILFEISNPVILKNVPKPESITFLKKDGRCGVKLSFAVFMKTIEEKTKKELEENGFVLSDLKKYDGFTWDEVWLKDNLAVCLDWYENGELEYKHNFKDGKKHGVCESWYPDGERKRKFNYKDGKYHGVFECWF